MTTVRWREEECEGMTNADQLWHHTKSQQSYHRTTKSDDCDNGMEQGSKHGILLARDRKQKLWEMEGDQRDHQRYIFEIHAKNASEELRWYTIQVCIFQCSQMTQRTSSNLRLHVVRSAALFWFLHHPIIRTALPARWGRVTVWHYSTGDGNRQQRWGRPCRRCHKLQQATLTQQKHQRSTSSI